MTADVGDDFFPPDAAAFAYSGSSGPRDRVAVLGGALGVLTTRRPVTTVTVRVPVENPIIVSVPALYAMTATPATMLRMSTILIVDDDPRFREQAADVLAADGFTVVGEAWDAASALREAAALLPEYVLVDIGLGGDDGFEVSRSLALIPQPPRVILTSSRDARAFGRRLRDGNSVGFIPKEQISGAAIRALDTEP